MKIRSELPDFEGDHDGFAHAVFDKVTFGPRQEFALFIYRLYRRGSNQGHWDNTPWQVRFGGVQSLEVARRFFSEVPRAQWELAGIEYVNTPRPKPGRIGIRIMMERTPDEFTCQCSNVTVTKIGGSEKRESCPLRN